MRSGNEDANRLQQILAWATDNYDGVMVFDEAHAMGGVAGGETGFGVTKGSLQGVTGVTLQNRLPEARVVYSSAKRTRNRPQRPAQSTIRQAFR